MACVGGVMPRAARNSLTSRTLSAKACARSRHSASACNRSPYSFMATPQPARNQTQPACQPLHAAALVDFHERGHKTQTPVRGKYLFEHKPAHEPLGAGFGQCLVGLPARGLDHLAEVNTGRACGLTGAAGEAYVHVLGEHRVILNTSFGDAAHQVDT